MKKPTIAAFDFDGTISYFDTLILFLWQTTNFFYAFFHLIYCLPTFIRFLNNKELRQPAKEMLLTQFLKGMPYAKALKYGQNYASGLLIKLIKKEALKRIDWHKKQGHILVLISANLDVYLKPWAESHGFHEVISSKLELSDQNLITGRLLGKNCWGQEKVNKLIDLYGAKENYCLYAYGNSRGDKELLEFADFPFYRTFS